MDDLDLDTDLDLVIADGAVPVRNLARDAQPMQVFENLTAQGQTGVFVDRSAATGLSAVGPRLARGSAVADFDNDGDPDVAVLTVGGPLVLLRNDGVVSNWLEVSLEGFHPGALVTATLADGTRMSREVRAGGSYLSSEDPRCEFGLGDSTVTDLTVRWPDGNVTHVPDPPPNQILVVEPPA